MSGPQVLVGEPAARSRSKQVPDPDTGWRIVGATSWVLILVGGVDLALSVFPTRFGAPDWEFGTASRLLDNLPLFTVGVMLQAASAAALGRSIWLRVLAWLMPIAVAVVLVSVVLFALALPLAMNEVTESGPRLLLMKAAAKTFVQAGAYFTLYSGVFVLARRVRR